MDSAFPLFFAITPPLSILDLTVLLLQTGAYLTKSYLLGILMAGPFTPFLCATGPFGPAMHYSQLLSSLAKLEILQEGLSPGEILLIQRYL
jgi:hypothetical protein